MGIASLNPSYVCGDNPCGSKVPSPACGRGLGRGAMVEFEASRGCPTASYFLLLVQNKVFKQKDTPCRLFPALLRKIRRLRNSRFQRSDSPRRKLPILLCCTRKGHARQVPAVSQRPWRHRRGKGIESQHHATTTVISLSTVIPA
jgi:hypothetical protein